MNTAPSFLLNHVNRPVNVDELISFYFVIIAGRAPFQLLVQFRNQES